MLSFAAYEQLRPNQESVQAALRVTRLCKQLPIPDFYVIAGCIDLA
jgi:hypothetical protein